MISFQEFKELVKTNASLQDRYEEKLKSCIDSSDNVTVQEVIEAELDEGKFVDEEFARWCNKHNMKWCDSNFFVGNDVTTLSNCCFDGDQEFYYYDSEGNKVLTSFRTYVDSKITDKDTSHQVIERVSGDSVIDPNTGNVAEIKAVTRLPNKHKKLICIELADGRTLRVTPDQKIWDNNSGKLVCAQDIVKCPEKYDI